MDHNYSIQSHRSTCSWVPYLRMKLDFPTPLSPMRMTLKIWSYSTLVLPSANANKCKRERREKGEEREGGRENWSLTHIMTRLYTKHLNKNIEYWHNHHSVYTCIGSRYMYILVDSWTKRGLEWPVWQSHCSQCSMTTQHASNNTENGWSFFTSAPQYTDWCT